MPFGSLMFNPAKVVIILEIAKKYEKLFDVFCEKHEKVSFPFVLSSTFRNFAA